MTQNAMEFFKNYSKFYCGNLDQLEQKLKKFARDGPEHFLVVADFDYTLSRSKTLTGEGCCLTYGVFEEEAKRTSKEIGRLFDELTEKYLPIELDANMPHHEKLPYMVDWWERSNDLILKAQYTEAAIEELVAKSSVRLRCGVDCLIDDLHRQQIPLVIFSAGIGNVIDICLRQKLANVPPNVHIISNMLLFDEKRVACKFSSPLIHTFCKNGSMIEKCPSLKKETQGRYNVLVLGDSLGDVNMADGYRPNGDHITTLKIGFLNRHIDTHFEKFADSFDIVLTDDQTVTVPRKIVGSICAGNFATEN